MQNIVAAYNLGKKLAFYKVAKPLAVGDSAQPAAQKSFGPVSATTMTSSGRPDFVSDLKKPEILSQAASSTNGSLGRPQESLNMERQQQIWADHYKKQLEAGKRINFNSNPRPQLPARPQPAAAPTPEPQPAVTTQNSQQRPAVSKVRAPDIYGTPGEAGNTLLAYKLTPEALAYHGYQDKSVEDLANRLREQHSAQVRAGGSGHEIARRMAFELAGNFAQMPEEEQRAFRQFEQGRRYDLQNYYGSGGASNDAGPLMLSTGEYRQFDDPKRQTTVNRLNRYSGGPYLPQYYSGPLKNPKDTYNLYSPNLMIDSRVDDLGIPLTDLQAAVFQPNIPGAKSHDEMSLPSLYNSQYGVYPHRFIDAGSGYDHYYTGGPTVAHELYHHKLNNLKRSHPIIGEFLDYLSRSDNEFLADMYSMQAPVSEEDIARTGALYQHRSDTMEHDPTDPHPADIDRARYHYVGPRY